MIQCKLSKKVNKPILDLWTEPFFRSSIRGGPSKGFSGFWISLIWNSWFGISLIWNSGFGISLMWNSGLGISFIWNSGFGISLFWNSGFGFSYLKLGIRDFPYGKQARSGLDSWLKVCAAGVMPKITIGFTGLHEILGRDYGIEEPYWGPSKRRENHAYSKLIFFLFLTAVFSWWRFGEAQEAFIVIQSSSYIQSKNAGIPGKLFFFVSSIF